jgi:hypothetical protein
LVYLSTLLFPVMYNTFLGGIYFLPFSIHAPTNVIYLNLLSVIVSFLCYVMYGLCPPLLEKTYFTHKHC